MNFKFFLTSLLLCFLFAGNANGQIVAEFDFEDTSNPPTSLLKNSTTPDDTSTYADSINPNAIGIDGGVYIEQDPATGEENINLQIPLKLVSEMKDFYLEWEVNWQDEDGWLLSMDGKTNGLDFISGIYFDKEKGFKVRYFRSAESGDTLVDTKWQIGGPITMGQKAVVGFFYDYSEGIAYLSLDGTEIWNTTMSKNEDGEFFAAAPEVPFNWNTNNNYFTVGSSITNSSETEIPFLYNFRISTEACYVAPPIVQNDTLCAGGFATLTASGGDPDTYLWYTSDSATVAIPNETDSTLQTELLDKPGTYTYYVAIKGDECNSDKVPVHAVVQEKPEVPSVDPLQFSRCGPGEVLVSLAAEEGVTYNWYSSKSVNSLLEEKRTSFTVQASSDTAIYVVAVNGSCISGDPKRIPIKVNPLPTIDAGPERTILKGESIQLSAIYDTDSISLEWSPSTGLDDINSPTPWAKPVQTTTYTITGTTTAGCIVSDSVTIQVIKEYPVTNAFSPNQDGRNDTWTIHNLKENYPDCIVMVYNNWGNQIFYSEGYPTEWDGTLNGKELPSGTYYYTIILNDTQEPLRGSLMILR